MDDIGRKSRQNFDSQKNDLRSTVRFSLINTSPTFRSNYFGATVDIIRTKKLFFLISGLLLLPTSVFAAYSPILPDVSNEPITDVHFLERYIGPGGLIITTIEGIAGLIAMGMLIWGGFLLITSGGNPEKVDVGKKAITAAVIGLIIVVSAYSITFLVVKVLGGGVIL